MQSKAVKTSPDKSRPLKVLAIGNSFSQDALDQMPQVLVGMGIKNFRLSNMYIGGCSLRLHLNNLKQNAAAYEFSTLTAKSRDNIVGATLKDGLLSDDWDYITVQQASHDSGKINTYSCLTEIIDYIKSIRPNAKIIWHMTWAYQSDSTHYAFEWYNKDQIYMYRAIIDAVKKEILTNPYINRIIPNGTAVQNARTSLLGDTLTRDGFHMSLDIGRYITAMNYAYVLTGQDITELSYTPAGMSPLVKKICIESVLNSVKCPFTVTQSAYGKAEDNFDLHGV